LSIHGVSLSRNRLNIYFLKNYDYYTMAIAVSSSICDAYHHRTVASSLLLVYSFFMETQLRLD
jgi:hypothetical protein